MICHSETMLHSKDLFIQKQRDIQRDITNATSYEQFQLRKYGSVLRGGKAIKLEDIDKYDHFGQPINPVRMTPTDCIPTAVSTEWAVIKKARENRDNAAIEAMITEGESGYWRVQRESLDKYTEEITDEDLEQIRN